MAGRKPVDPEKRKGYDGKKIPFFCKNVRAKRIEMGLTQQQLADLIVSPRPRVSEIENGHMPGDSDRIIALADALGVDLNWLFGREWPKNKESQS